MSGGFVLKKKKKNGEEEKAEKRRNCFKSRTWEKFNLTAKGKLHFAGIYSRIFSWVYAHASECQCRVSGQQPCCSLEVTLVSPLCLHSRIVLERLAFFT